MGDGACGRPPTLRSEKAACLFSGAAAAGGHRRLVGHLVSLVGTIVLLLVSLVGGHRFVVSSGRRTWY